MNLEPRTLQVTEVPMHIWPYWGVVSSLLSVTYFKMTLLSRIRVVLSNLSLLLHLSFFPFPLEHLHIGVHKVCKLGDEVPLLSAGCNSVLGRGHMEILMGVSPV